MASMGLPPIKKARIPTDFPARLQGLQDDFRDDEDDPEVVPHGDQGNPQPPLTTDHKSKISITCKTGGLLRDS